MTDKKTINIKQLEEPTFTQEDVEKFIEDLDLCDPITEAIAWAMDEARYGNTNGWRVATEALVQYNALYDALKSAQRLLSVHEFDAPEDVDEIEQIDALLKAR